MQRYTYAPIHQIVSAGAYGKMYTIDQRCAGWLLMTYDRRCSDRFLLTQEYLAEMLGVRRATVNSAIGILKSAAAIKFTRGQITVLNRAGLEFMSCSYSKTDTTGI
jgi:CRP-like cAMP-binding protein